MMWMLVAAFLVFSTAWSMTLRPEPFVAFLSLVSLVAMMRFCQHPGPVPLGLAIIASALAFAAHPTGLVSLAPLIVSAPSIVLAVRRGVGISVGALAAVLTSGFAAALVFIVLDSDLAHRVRDIRVVRAGELHGESFWDEYLRYTMFEEWGGGTTLRRLSLVMFAFSVAAILARRSRPNVETLPAWSLAVGLALLAFVPSKWPWHFGALTAVACVAFSIEVEALARMKRSPSRTLQLVIALLLISCGGVWAWSASGTSQSPFGLQIVSWRAGFNGGTWIIVGLLLPSIALVIYALRSRMRGRTPRDPLSLALVWLLSALCLGAVAITVALLVIDALRAPWTPTRQNLNALARHSDCGLAHVLSVPPPHMSASRSEATLVHPTLGMFFPCALPPTITKGGLVELPRFLIVQDQTYEILIPESPFMAVTDLAVLEPLGHGPRGIRVIGVKRVVPGFARADALAKRA